MAEQYGGLILQHAHDKKERGPITEMAIVNTFTKLIFGDEGYTSRELLIIEAFRIVDPNVLRDSLAEMGEYLRSLGVREMIHLVSRLRQHMHEGGESAAVNPGPAAPSPKIGRPGPDRGTHH